MEKQASKKDFSNRVWLIDELRGLSIVLMVIYHFFYDLVFLFGVKIELIYSPFIGFLVNFFAGLFIFISGTACLYSRSNLNRGLKCVAFAALFSLCTFIIMPDMPDRFGILHLLGLSMLLFALLQKPLSKINPYFGLFLFSALFLVLFNLPQGYLFFKPFGLSLPDSFYSANFLYPFGLPSPSFRSLDYFPLLPWSLLFVAGTFFGTLLKQKKMPEFFYQSHLKPLSFIGRNTIWIYLFHQPVLFGALWVCFSLIRQ